MNTKQVEFSIVRYKRIAFAVSLSALAAGQLCWFNVGVKSQALPESRYQNLNSNRCIGVDRASIANLAAIKQFTCQDAGNQRWQTVTLPNPEHINLRNVGSGKCLGVDGASTAEGARLLQFDCVGALNQAWIRRGNDRLAQFQNVKSDLCIGVADESTANSAQLVQVQCTGDHQWWRPL